MCHTIFNCMKCSYCRIGTINKRPLYPGYSPSWKGWKYMVCKKYDRYICKWPAGGCEHHTEEELPKRRRL